MKRTVIASAVGTLLATAAGSAFALAPGAFDPATIKQVRMSGATAQDSGIEAIVARMCAASSLDVYTTAGNSQVAYVCNTGTAFGTLAAGSPIAIHKEKGGSSNGINPVKSGGAALNFINLASLAGCTATTVASVAPVTPDTLGTPGFTRQACTGSLEAQSSFIGFSDVDPPLFSATSTGLTLRSPNQLIFGVPVTIALRNALQSAGCVGSDTVACQPSLTRSQVAGIYAGNIGNASQLGAAPGSIYVARRGSGSGTQATAEVYFLNQRITTTASTTSPFMQPSDDGTTNYGGNTAVSSGVNASDLNCGNATVAPTEPSPGVTPVVAMNGSGQVVNCLNRHAAGNRYAVGVLTTEFDQFGTSAKAKVDTNFNMGFRYVKINGALPTIGNVIRGDYDYFSEQVIATRTTGTPGVEAAVATYFNTQLGNPDVISSIDNNWTRWTDAPAGEQLAGLLQPARASSCRATFASLAAPNNTPDTDPINYTTKNPSATKVNNAIKPAIAVCPPRF